MMLSCAVIVEFALQTNALDGGNQNDLMSEYLGFPEHKCNGMMALQVRTTWRDD